MNNIDYVLASGDSWTAGWMEGDDGVARHADKSVLWPHLLAKKLDVPYVNLGESAQSNSYIYHSILEHILSNSDQRPLVCCIWTEAFRFTLPIGFRPKVLLNNGKGYTHRIIKPNCSNHPGLVTTGWWIPGEHQVTGEEWTYVHRDPSSWKDDRLDFANTYMDKFFNQANLVFQSYLHILSLQEFCKAWCIPFLFLQGMSFSKSCESLNEQFLNEFDFDAALKIMQQIDPSTFLWWNYPKTKESLSSENSFQDCVTNKNFDIIDKSYHPSKEGHKYLTNLFYQMYEEKYLNGG